jgi:hypothetical protein
MIQNSGVAVVAGVVSVSLARGAETAQYLM